MPPFSAVPGFGWPRRYFQMWRVYVAVGVLLPSLTLVVSPPIQRLVLAVLGAAGVNFPSALALIFVEIGLRGGLAFFAGPAKGGPVTAGGALRVLMSAPLFLVRTVSRRRLARATSV